MNKIFIKKAIVYLLLLTVTAMLGYNKYDIPVIATVSNLSVLLFVPDILKSSVLKKTSLKYTIALLFPVISLILVVVTTGTEVFMKQTFIFSVIALILTLLQLYKEKR